MSDAQCNSWRCMAYNKCDIDTIDPRYTAILHVIVQSTTISKVRLRSLLELTKVIWRKVTAKYRDRTVPRRIEKSSQYTPSHSTHMHVKTHKFSNTKKLVSTVQNLQTNCPWYYIDDYGTEYDYGLISINVIPPPPPPPPPPPLVNRDYLRWCRG